MVLKHLNILNNVPFFAPFSLQSQTVDFLTAFLCVYLAQKMV
jgi:hypothetical protein